MLCGGMWDLCRPEHIDAMLASGELRAYYFGPCLVLIQTVNYQGGRELCVYGTAGRGIFRGIGDLHEDLVLLAAYLGCTAIGFIGKPAWAKLAKRFGGKPVRVHFVEEL